MHRLYLLRPSSSPDSVPVTSTGGQGRQEGFFLALYSAVRKHAEGRIQLPEKQLGAAAEQDPQRPPYLLSEKSCPRTR